MLGCVQYEHHEEDSRSRESETSNVRIACELWDASRRPETLHRAIGRLTGKRAVALGQIHPALGLQQWHPPQSLNAAPDTLPPAFPGTDSRVPGTSWQQTPPCKHDSIMTHHSDAHGTSHMHCSVDHVMKLFESGL